jgi:class 3 adenylate cyclase/tetratricopeptide (TPR) repeat protein
MATSVVLETLASYIPNLVLQRLAAQPAVPAEPSSERFAATVLAADISGFTALTEHLAHDGPAGAEALSNIINDYFGQLIDLLTAHGGDVVEFTGDGLIALWPATPAPGTMTENGDTTGLLRTTVQRAAQAGLAVQQSLGGYRLDEHIAIALRIGIGVGEVLVATVGGVRQRWELLFAGDPLVQVSTAGQHAVPGDVVLSAEAWRLVAAHGSGEVLAGGSVRLQHLQIAPPPLPLPDIGLTPAMDAAMRAYLPGAMVARLDAGQTRWLAELRVVTVVFLNVHGIDYTARRILYRLHVIMRALQKYLYRYEGSVYQFIVDDKGTTFVAAFGLPPLTHEDDAVRGVQAALEMRHRLQHLGVQCSIGITTGRVFCGSRGNARRRDYAMIGDVVNLAARLMQCASNDILCDTATRISVQHASSPTHLTFEALPPLRIKGKAEPVPCYRPHLQERLTTRQPVATVGRQAERALLLDAVEHLLHCWVQQQEHMTGHAASSASGTITSCAHAHMVIIEGEAGMGKSHLVYELQQQAHLLDVPPLLGPASAIEHDTPYHAWRSIFWHLFDLDALPDDSAQRRSHVLAHLAADPYTTHLAPLINAVLPLDVRDNERTEQMRGQVRADNTHHLLLHLLQHTAARQPLLLIFESAHWMDSASYALVLAASQRITPLLIIIATRPPFEPLPSAYSSLLAQPGTRRLALDSLPPGDIERLVCRWLGVISIPEAVLNLVLEKAEGNPLFSEELTYALRDTGLITVEQGRCRLAAHAGDMRDLPFPDSVQGVITSRVDRLPPAEQLTLKVASVVGHVFARRILHDIYPIEPGRTALGEHLQRLERLNIITLQSTEPEPLYAFKHIIIQETIYNRLLFAQRRELHRAVAEWYEQSYAEDLTPFYALLAHHWSKAEVTWKAIDYLAHAGEHALRNYANKEAIHFLRQALALNHSDTLPTTTARRYRLLGEAALNLGQLSESRAALLQALTLLGKPMPATRPALLAGLLRGIGQQVLHRLWWSRFAHCRRARHAQEREMAHIYSGLIAVYYLSNQVIRAIYASLRNMNLTECTRADAAPETRHEMAQAYANMGLVAGSLALHRLARMYGHYARTIAMQSNHAATLAYVLNLTSIYDVGAGQWERLTQTLPRALACCEQIDDQRLWGANMILLAQVRSYTGAFAPAQHIGAVLYQRARRNGDMLQQAWALGVQGQSALRLGKLDEAVSYLEAAIVWLIESDELPSQISNYGLLAVARLRQGDALLARLTADATARLIGELPLPGVSYLLEGYAGVAEVYLALWEAEVGSTAPRHPAPLPSLLYAQSRDACASLQRYARIFPIGQPRAWCWQGLYAWLSGQRQRAHQAWRKSLAAAQRLKMPYEQALAHYEIGRHTSGIARKNHLVYACTLFERVEATYDFGKAQRALYDT